MYVTGTIHIAFLRWKRIKTLSLTRKTTDHKCRWQQTVHVANHCAWLFRFKMASDYPVIRGLIAPTYTGFSLESRSHRKYHSIVTIFSDSLWFFCFVRVKMPTARARVVQVTKTCFVDSVATASSISSWLRYATAYRKWFGSTVREKRAQHAKRRAQLHSNTLRHFSVTLSKRTEFDHQMRQVSSLPQYAIWLGLSPW